VFRTHVGGVTTCRLMCRGARLSQRDEGGAELEPLPCGFPSGQDCGGEIIAMKG
jgi:hypothetical protein